MEGASELLPAIILLVVGVAAVIVMRWLRLSPIVGYLAGGLLIGPHAFGLIEDNHTAHLLAELGVVFLLFDIGLHFSLREVWEARRDIFGLGPIQITFCLAAFTGLAMLLGLPFQVALVLGGALALSSTAVVIPTLRDRELSNCPVGRTATAVLIFQDVLAIFLLILASSMMPIAEGSEDVTEQVSLGMLVVTAVLKAAVAFAGAMALGRFAVRPLFKLVAQTRNEEVFTALALLIVLAMAAASGVAGLSLTLGAFLGGMMLADSSFSHLIRTECKPFRSLLLAFFFISIGMSLDWHVLISSGWQILVCVAVLIAVKAVLISLSAKLVGWSVPGSMQLGFLLAQSSEFVFVIVAMPAVRSAVGEALVGILFAGTVISLALTPTVAELGNRMARWTRKRMAIDIPKKESTPTATLPPVVIFGMGSVGRTVADAMEAFDIKYDAVERNHDIFAAASIDGYKVTFGDLGDYRLSETMSMSERCVIAITDVRFEVSKDLEPIARERFPKLKRLVCVKDQQEAQRYEVFGMESVVDDENFPGQPMARRILALQRIEKEKIDEWFERRNQAVEATTA